SWSNSVIAGFSSSMGGMLSLASLRLIPVEDALFPYIEEAHQHQQNVNQHLPEAEHLQLARNHGPGIKEDSLDIEQDKEHGHHVEFYVEASLGISGGHDAAFIR